MISRISLPEVVGGGYGAFWRCRSRYRVLMGGKASKKSATTALNFIVRMMQYPGANLLVVRAVANTHRDSTFAQLKWAIGRLGVDHLWACTVSPLEIVYKPTGQKILFRGFDDVLKLASTTVASGCLCWVWIEEAYEIKREADFIKLDMSVPRGQVPAGLFKQTTLTFNPWSDKHWLKSRFFDEPDELTETFTTTYRCNEFLDKTDLAVFERMKRENPRQYAIIGNGEWGVAEGLVYENWSVEPFDVNELGIERDEDGKIEKDESWRFRRFYGLDYGYTNDPTAFIAFAADPENKWLYVFDEFYEKKMSNSDIAAKITGMGYAKERIRADAAEPKSNDDLRRAGISHLLPSVKGRDSVANGIANLQEYRIVVHPKCLNTVGELSTYCFQPEKNEPADENNHLMDAMRYAFYDVRFFHPEKPERRRVNYETRAGIRPEDMKGGWDG